jgi:hypothetical protein
MEWDSPNREGTIPPHMWEEKKACPFTPREEWGKLCFIVILCCHFESLKRRGDEFGGSKRKTRRKTSRGSEKKLNNSALERGGEGFFSATKRN